jgi:hypothetical protein
MSVCLRIINSAVGPQINLARLDRDAIFEIFKHCLAKGDIDVCFSLAYTNKHYHKTITSGIKEINLKQICPLLDILDAARLGIEVEDESKLSKLQMVKLYHMFDPCIESSILTMYKGFTRKKLFAIATESGMDLKKLFPTAAESKEQLNLPLDKNLTALDEAPLEATYRLMLRNKHVDEIVDGKVQEETRIVIYEEGGKQMIKTSNQAPIAQEYLALCIFQEIFNKKCVYEQPRRTSTRVRGCSLVIEGSASTA